MKIEQAQLASEIFIALDNCACSPIEQIGVLQAIAVTVVQASHLCCDPGAPGAGESRGNEVAGSGGVDAGGGA